MEGLFHDLVQQPLGKFLGIINTRPPCLPLLSAGYVLCLDPDKTNRLVKRIVSSRYPGLALEEDYRILSKHLAIFAGVDLEQSTF